MCEKSDVCTPKRILHSSIHFANGVKQSEGHQLNETIQNETQIPFFLALRIFLLNGWPLALHSDGIHAD